MLSYAHINKRIKYHEFHEHPNVVSSNELSNEISWATSEVPLTLIDIYIYIYKKIDYRFVVCRYMTFKSISYLDKNDLVTMKKKIINKSRPFLTL